MPISCHARNPEFSGCIWHQSLGSCHGNLRSMVPSRPGREDGAGITVVQGASKMRMLQPAQLCVTGVSLHGLPSQLGTLYRLPAHLSFLDLCWFCCCSNEITQRLAQRQRSLKYSLAPSLMTHTVEVVAGMVLSAPRDLTANRMDSGSAL